MSKWRDKSIEKTWVHSDGEVYHVCISEADFGKEKIFFKRKYSKYLCIKQAIMRENKFGVLFYFKRLACWLVNFEENPDKTIIVLPLIHNNYKRCKREIVLC